MGIRMVVEVLDCYHGPARHKLWLIAFCEQANERTRRGWPPRELLATRAGVSVSRASHIATDLVDQHILKRVGGGRKHSGPAQYELLAVVHSQDAPRAHSEDTAQDAELAHPENGSPDGSQGADSDSQGAFWRSQGARPSPLPAQTPGLNPSLSSPLSSSPLTRSKSGLPDGRTQQAALASDEPSRPLILRRVFTAAQAVYGDGTAEKLSDDEAVALYRWIIRDRVVPHPARYLTKTFRDSLKKDNGATAGLGRLVEKARQWAAEEEDRSGTARLPGLSGQGDLAGAEAEIEQMLGYCDTVEMSTITGMLSAGSHPAAVLAKILSDRRGP
jgi:hypothetical protein